MTDEQKVANVHERATSGDPFRKTYTPLTDEQKDGVRLIKDKAEELLELYNAAIDPTERSPRSRDMALARTYLEDSVMRAVRAVTTKITA